MEKSSFNSPDCDADEVRKDADVGVSLSTVSLGWSGSLGVSSWQPPSLGAANGANSASLEESWGDDCKTCSLEVSSFLEISALTVSGLVASLGWSCGWDAGATLDVLTELAVLIVLSLMSLADAI